MEERIGYDGIVDFCLEEVDEAGLAELLMILGADDQSSRCLAESTEGGRHGVRVLNGFVTRVPYSQWVVGISM